VPEIISANDALQQLLGNVCQGCNGHKPSRMSHCRRCYFSLPKAMQRALYKRIGEGYEAAYAESLEMIKEERNG
jgi:ribosomal protein L40E